jgi:hopanoid biosynthesis associated protein HpnK
MLRRSQCASPPSDHPPRLIVTADDFGRCSAINEAVARAHDEGVLTAASLMVTGEAAAEAVEIARRTPSLAVGLHLVLTDGRAALPPEEIPHLVDGEGRFSRDPARAGLRYFFHPQARRELAREIAAQFERFAATGLPLDHVDGHQHLHLHPIALRHLLPLARQYGAGRIRVPRDRLGPALRGDRRRLPTKFLHAGVFSLLGPWARRKICRAGLDTTPWSHGLLQSGHMREEYVVRLLGSLRDTAEIYFHPTTGPRLDALGPNPGDLAALLSPAVRAAMQERRLQLL